jgi:hypothetical protein
MSRIFFSSSRVGAFLLEGVLRGHDEERLFELSHLPAGGHLLLLHRLEHGALRLRCGAVDFVSEHDLREDRPGHEGEMPPAAGFGFHDHVGADDVGGHEVGRELDAAELEAQRLRQRANQRGLAEPWHAFEQRMPADEEARQHAVDDLFMPDDRLGDLLLHRLVIAAEAIAQILHLRINPRNICLNHSHSPFFYFGRRLEPRMNTDVVHYGNMETRRRRTLLSVQHSLLLRCLCASVVFQSYSCVHLRFQPSFSLC